jgi:DNA-binding transcriptional ArsR family regulator
MVDDRAGKVFAALADPTRRQVVEELRRRPSVTASELAREFPMTRQALAKHLATLSAAGLVAGERLGRETRYRLAPEPLGDAVAWMVEAGAAWDVRLDRLARSVEPRA